MFWTRYIRAFATALALPMMLAGCVSFTPPRYDGEVSKIEKPIELVSVIDGNFVFTERSMATTKNDINLGGGVSMTGTGKIRSDTSAHFSITETGEGYVMAVVFDSIAVEPISGLKNPDAHRLQVEDLGCKGLLDGYGAIIAFDVDVMSEEWLSLDSDRKQTTRDRLEKWKKRRQRSPVMPDRITSDTVIEVDIGDTYANDAMEEPTDFQVEGTAIYRFAGTTTYRGRSHLLLVLDGEIAGVSKKQKMTITGKLSGYTLIDITNGDPVYWELGEQFKVTTPIVTMTIDEKTEGALTRQ